MDSPPAATAQGRRTTLGGPLVAAALEYIECCMVSVGEPTPMTSDSMHSERWSSL
jgi:hypothetical protein